MALDRDEYKKVLREFVRDFKKLSGCKICHISDPEQLEFHHRDPAKKIWTISDMVIRGNTLSLEALLIEIKKCDVLCDEHHEIADKILLEKYNYKLPVNPQKQSKRHGGRKKKR